MSISWNMLKCKLWPRSPCASRKTKYFVASTLRTCQHEFDLDATDCQRGAQKGLKMTEYGSSSQDHLEGCCRSCKKHLTSLLKSMSLWKNSLLKMHGVFQSYADPDPLLDIFRLVMRRKSYPPEFEPASTRKFSKLEEAYWKEYSPTLPETQAETYQLQSASISFTRKLQNSENYRKLGGKAKVEAWNSYPVIPVIPVTLSRSPCRLPVIGQTSATEDSCDSSDHWDVFQLRLLPYWWMLAGRAPAELEVEIFSRTIENIIYWCVYIYTRKNNAAVWAERKKSEHLQS